MSIDTVERDLWVDSELRRIAPALADVPEQTQRFLSNVQRMLAATSPIEAQRYAAEVARKAEALALLRVEYVRLRAMLMERAPNGLRVFLPTGPT